MEGRHMRGADCMSLWQYQLNLELQLSMDGYNHVGFILYFICVYTLLYILGFLCICTWYMYEMLTGLHEQMEKLTNCLPHCPRMNNIP